MIHIPLWSCSVLFLNVLYSDKTKETKQEDMMVATASDDGTVKLWHPFQVGLMQFACNF